MAPNVNSGVVDPADRLAEELVEGVSDVLHLVDVQRFPFYSILQALPSPAAKNVQVKCNQERNRPVHAALSASATNAATALSVATGQGAYFKVNDLISLQVGSGTFELCVVTGVTSDNVGVTRSVGEVAAASAASGASILILGQAVAQGASLQDQIYVAASSGYNYTEVF